MNNKIELARICVDFNNADEKGRFRLITYGAITDIKRLNLALKDGLLINIYQDDDDFEVLARVEFSREEQTWVAVADWSTRKEL